MKVSPSLSTLLEDMHQKFFDGLPDTLTYHNFEHTVLVTQLAQDLAIEANLNQHNLDVLYAAAVLHDTGYVVKYKSNERQGANHAVEELPAFGFSAEDISTVVDIIKATSYEFEPQTELQKLIKDADLGYLGRTDFFEWSNRLFDEYKSMNLFKGDEIEWLANQISFLTQHTYHTPAGVKLFEEGKQKNLSRLKALSKWPS